MKLRVHARHWHPLMIGALCGSKKAWLGGVGDSDIVTCKRCIALLAEAVEQKLAPLVHRSNALGQAYCTRSAFNVNSTLTDTWAKTTCPRCLKQRPAVARMPP